MFEFIESLDFQVFKVIGMVISGGMGLVMSLISKRSVNYRKIDKSLVLSCFLFFVYLNAIPMATILIGTIVVIILGTNTILTLAIAALFMAVISFVLCWCVLFRTKRIKYMMEKAKAVSRRTFLTLNGISIVSVVMTFAYFPHTLLEQENLFTNTLEIFGWIIMIWWFYLLIAIVWKNAHYIYSEMKITLLDGEVIRHSCRPQMCRVHRNYVRLIERDEKGATNGERHINEVAIKQIEYS